MPVFSKTSLAAFAIAAASLLPTPTIAAEDPLFSFIPPGGRTILEGLISGGLDEKELEALMSGQRSREEWLAELKAKAAANSAIAALDETSLDTLAAYLASSMPMSGFAGKTIDTSGRALPRDGRDLTLEYCQSCHIITVVVTQKRPRVAWLGTMNKPSHIEVDLTTSEREAVADYLERNAGISIEDVPEELRAGGATY